jgi:phage shock protein A
VRLLTAINFNPSQDPKIFLLSTMPSPEQRLDQLEPVISEMLAKQDETAAKVERVSAQVRQLTVTATNALTTQSNNIEFLLTQTQQLTEGQAKLEQGQAELKQQVNQGFAQIIALINERLK